MSRPPPPTAPDRPRGPLRAFVLDQRRIGFFAQLTQILLLARHCEEAGLTPYFHVTNANLVDPAFGPNWVDYFFEQHAIGAAERAEALARIAAGEAIRIASRHDINLLALGRRFAELQNELGGIDEAARLFHRHLRFRAAIREATDGFIAAAFGDAPYIGVHYRGTDKFGTEAAPVAPEAVARQIEAHRAGRPIFVATDSRDFLEFCRARFGGEVAAHSRPDGRAHLEWQDRNHEKGRNAAIDCLVLARSSLLIKTPSLLSAWSKVFAPALPLVLVGEPVRAPWGETSLAGLGYWPESRLYDRRPDVARANGVLCFAPGDGAGEARPAAPA